MLCFAVSQIPEISGSATFNQFLLTAQQVNYCFLFSAPSWPFHTILHASIASYVYRLNTCVLRDCSDASTNILDQLYGGLVPGASGFNCHWQKDVRGRQRAILYSLVRCCLVCSWACLCGSLDLCATQLRCQELILLFLLLLLFLLVDTVFSCHLIGCFSCFCSLVW